MFRESAGGAGSPKAESEARPLAIRDHDSKISLLADGRLPGKRDGRDVPRCTETRKPRVVGEESITEGSATTAKPSAASAATALFFGPGIARGQVVDREVDQISVAGTVGALMNFKAAFAEGPVLEEVFA